MTELLIVYRIPVHASCVIQVSHQSVSCYFYSIIFCYIIYFLSFSIENITFITKPIKYVAYLGTAVQSMFLLSTSYTYSKFPLSAQ